MLMLLSFLMLACFIYFLMSKRLSALTALILIPTAFALIGGFQADLGKYVIDGLKMVAPNGVLMIFAMLYFLTMTEAGMFDPLVSKIVKAVRGDPVKIFVGTVLLAFIVALDGDGATIYMIVLSAFLPIYKRLGLSLPMVCCLLLQVAGLGNMVPWGGPTARAATAMHVDVGQMFVPMLPAMIACVIWTFVLAWLFGRRERARLGSTIDLNGDFAETAQHHGITAVEMARASLIGQPVHILSPLVASTYLVVSMLKLDYAENQRFTMKWSVINCFILLAVSLLTGIFPLFVR